MKNKLLVLISILVLYSVTVCGQHGKHENIIFNEDKDYIYLLKDYPEYNHFACFIFSKKNIDKKSKLVQVVNEIKALREKDSICFIKPFGYNLANPDYSPAKDYLIDTIHISAHQDSSRFMVTKLDQLSLYYINCDENDLFNKKLSGQLAYQLQSEKWDKRNYWVMLSGKGKKLLTCELDEISPIARNTLLSGGGSLDYNSDIQFMKGTYEKALSRTKLIVKIFMPMNRLLFFEQEALPWILNLLDSGVGIEFFTNNPTDQLEIDKLNRLKKKYKESVIKFNLI